jgi:hypothetical protein
MTLKTLFHALARTEMAMGAGLLLTEIGLALSTLALRIAAAGLELSSQRLGTVPNPKGWATAEQLASLLSRPGGDRIEPRE